MSDFWLVINVILDAFPWIFLLYMPFKDRLRFSRITTVLANFVVLTLYYISFKRIIGEDFYNLDIMLAYRMVQIFVVLILCIYFINDFYTESFVCVWPAITNKCFCFGMGKSHK